MIKHLENQIRDLQKELAEVEKDQAVLRLQPCRGDPEIGKKDEKIDELDRRAKTINGTIRDLTRKLQLLISESNKGASCDSPNSSNSSYGTFQDRRPDEKTPDAHHAAEPNPSRNAEMSPLFQKIIEVAQEHEYIPKEEFLLVPELRPYQEKIVDFICTYISKDMKAVGLDEEQMLGVFKFVFGRGWDSVYQWHKRPDGKIENVVTVGGNLLRGDVFLQLPDDIRYAINKSDAPRIIYDIMASWWGENQNDLRSKGIDIWSPLTVALSATFEVAVSMALKTFGYGK